MFVARGFAIATVFFALYVLIAALVIVNLLIGIVINSMERAHEEESADARRRGQNQRAFLLEQITAMRRSLDETDGGVDRSTR